jgi:PST family polysaccharide transporter
MSYYWNLAIVRLKNKFPILNSDKQIIANISWLLGDKIVRLLIGFIITVLTARYLGPADFGFLNYAFSFVWLFENLVTMGTNDIIIQDLVRNSEDRNKIFGTAIILRGIGGILSFLVIFTYFQINPDELSRNFLIYIMAISMIMKNAGVIRFWYESRFQNKYVIVSESISVILSAAFKVWCIINHKPLPYFFWTYLLEVIISSVIITLFFHKSKEHISNWYFDKPTIYKLLKSSWSLIFTGFFIMVILRSGQILLKELATDEEVGLYAAATRITDLYIFIPTSIIISYFPEIIRKKTDTDNYKRKIQNLTDLVFIICLAFTLFLTLFSEVIIVNLFGSNYIKSNSIMKILSWSSLLLVINVLSGRYLILEGWQNLQLIRSITGAVITISLNVILIPSLGATGAAIGVVCGLISTIIFILLVKKGRFWSNILLSTLYLPGMFERLSGKKKEQ